MKNLITNIKISAFLFSILFCSMTSCDDFIDVDPPRTELIRETVFSDDVTAEAAMTDIYYQFKTMGFASGGYASVSLVGAFASDEMIYTGTDIRYVQFNTNELQPTNALLGTMWNDLYNIIYKTNAIMEGCLHSQGMSAEAKDRLMAEAKFIRAFCYFYLVNLWGDVPLVITTDYRINNTMSRTPVADVYALIKQDLKDAAEKLPADYAMSNDERVRANKWAATALLARVCLYMGEWEEAESEASKVIDQTSLFSLESALANIFRKTSPEAILQWWSQVAPQERGTFFVYSFGPAYGAGRPEYIDSYEAGDQRWIAWGRTRVVGAVTYRYHLKYPDPTVPPLDYSTVFRLAEQYLIRAEARIKQDKLTTAKEDIDVIRNRAGLDDTPSLTKEELFNDIIAQRKAEFPTEWGHRWLDLKRWDLADEVLDPIKTGWTSSDVLFPIPEAQIISNPNIIQNTSGE